MGCRCGRPRGWYGRPGQKLQPLQAEETKGRQIWQRNKYFKLNVDIMRPTDFKLLSQIMKRKYIKQVTSESLQLMLQTEIVVNHIERQES